MEMEVISWPARESPSGLQRGPGCQRCKTRRVKCSRHRPMCTNCHRRTETCIYPHASIPASSTERRIMPVPVMAIPTNTTTDSSAQLPLTRLLPLSHPTLVTWWFKDISVGSHPTSPAERALWRLALSNVHLSTCTYLWHGILSTHLLHTLPPAEHTSFGTATDLAYQHHLAGSSSFSSSSPLVNNHTWLPVLTFGISVIVFQFGAQQLAPDALFDYIEMLLVLRNSAKLASSVVHFFRASAMWPLVRQRGRGNPVLPADGVNAALQYLADAVARAEFGDETCHRSQALQALRDWVLDCRACPAIWRDYIYWPGKVPGEFLDALRAEDDVALLLVLHWCAVLWLGPRRWFMERWILRTARWVGGRVRGEWGRCLVWPRRVLGEGFEGGGAGVGEGTLCLR
ncbi:hypothetical protein EJ04DRAFT_557680 [Polyplosphaeria fusca]|uniref:Zn(2)-C6 fungal-type domain-containing protein n=1 Tax=Polyplosphaeria fusca TaxID=682080 RepID=A0A9P4QLC9_9PLEO|nr:hypothetical protein EJ04DRAFT_557680 [Polyplosphaeria fusca]